MARDAAWRYTLLPRERLEKLSGPLSEKLRAAGSWQVRVKHSNSTVKPGVLAIIRPPPQPLTKKTGLAHNHAPPRTIIQKTAKCFQYRNNRASNNKQANVGHSQVPEVNGNSTEPLRTPDARGSGVGRPTLPAARQPYPCHNPRVRDKLRRRSKHARDTHDPHKNHLLVTPGRQFRVVACACAPRVCVSEGSLNEIVCATALRHAHIHTNTHAQKRRGGSGPGPMRQF